MLGGEVSAQHRTASCEEQLPVLFGIVLCFVMLSDTGGIWAAGHIAVFNDPWPLYVAHHDRAPGKETDKGGREFVLLQFFRARGSARCAWTHEFGPKGLWRGALLA